MGATVNTRLRLSGMSITLLSDSMKVRIKRLREEAFLPEYAHGPSEDAGLDLRAVDDVALPPGVPRLVPTGLAIELPPGCEAQIRPRSGLALKHAITLPNSPATIDPGYRGEIRVILLNQFPPTYENSIGNCSSIRTCVSMLSSTRRAEICASSFGSTLCSPPP